MEIDPIEIGVQDAAVKIAENPSIKLIDVREESECAFCCLEGSTRLTEDLAEKMISSWSRDEDIIFYCHHGGHSRAAAEYFYQQGFLRVRNMTGGIDAWSQFIDSKIPRY